MLYQGNKITVSLLDDGIAKMHFDNQTESVNKFDQTTLKEFNEAIESLENHADVKGVIVTSGKGVFIAGADITEFVVSFKNSEEAIAEWGLKVNQIFNRFEDLSIPKVVAINGAAMGGGYEMCLVCDYRVMSDKATVGLPEVKLGLFPGFGGSVRLPRLIGLDNALEMIATGAPHKPDSALKLGLVDAVVPADNLENSAIDLVKKCINGDLDWKARHAEKINPIKLNQLEQAMAFNSAKGVLFAKANPAQYPAPKIALETMEKHVNLTRDEALKVESKGFAQVAKTPQTEALVGIFLNDQFIKKQAKKYTKNAKDVNLASVLGAGIMGGGIAYQSAVKGTPIIMKDIGNKQLDLGMSEANKLLTKQVERKKLTPAKMGETLARIRPTLSYDEFKEVDIVVEAVTENPAIKEKVLADVESKVSENTIIASNTSTISITRLAKALQRPENFVGMHFFNPVHMMPLVEVIRGEKTSDEAIATTVAYAQKMGKSPIVVNDCPGFLVNRVLFPYFGAFDLLLKDGADFVQIDKTMEKFGWPMGPAYLADVVGIDTCVHGAEVMAEGFPDRMKPDFQGAVQTMYDNNRLGQKNDVGFYKYELDKKGKKAKTIDPTTDELIAKVAGKAKSEFDPAEITERMMIAFCNETVRCLEDKIVETPAEADMAMIMGVGFPAFRGGPCRYIDQVGLKEYVAICEKYKHLGKAYEAPQMLVDMANNGKTFY